MIRVQKNVLAGLSGADAFRNSQGPYSEFRALHDELEHNLLRYLQKGRLKGLGYSAPRQVSSSIEAVPIELWDGIINWSNSTAEADGLKMVAVRIVDTLWEEQIQEIADPSPDRGRPSRADHIVAGFHALHEIGEIELTGAMNHNYPAIREWVKTHHPTPEDPDRDLGDKLFAQLINPLIKAAREALYNL